MIPQRVGVRRSLPRCGPAGSWSHTWGDVWWIRSCLVFQHHPRGLRRRPVLPGPVERRPGQALQLRRPGDLDAHRRPADRGRLRGARRRLSLHLAAICASGERRLEGLGPEEGLSRVTRWCVFNVQHLYVACLDEGKTKEGNTGPCFSGIRFHLPEVYFFSVKKLGLDSTGGAHCSDWKWMSFPCFIFCCLSRSVSLGARPGRLGLQEPFSCDAGGGPVHFQPRE